jgi:hypothetical protein
VYSAHGCKNEQRIWEVTCSESAVAKLSFRGPAELSQNVSCRMADE